MGNPYVDAQFISRETLREIVRDNSYENEINERMAKAVQEFNERTNGVKDNRRRFLILKEVAAKYRFREEWFVYQVKL